MPEITSQLLYNTFRLDCLRSDGSGAVGTAFLFRLRLNAGSSIPVLVTNKHVVEGARSCTIRMCAKAPDGSAIPGQTHDIILDNFEDRWIIHPDQEVDLCVMPMQEVWNASDALGVSVLSISIGEEQIPTEEEWNDLTPAESVTMLGYPSALWDQQNNFPLIRQGITATPPYVNYEGRREFMVDLACFPGSSGSPIFAYSAGGTYISRSRGAVIGVRMKLLGILYAGPIYTVEGQIEVRKVPTKKELVPLSRIPMHLGYAIRSVVLADFAPILQRHV
jgi:hypothetical protein